jgi:hypothetical protein
MEAQRARLAILMPLIALVAAAASALFIGFLLHQVPHGSAPAMALALVLIVTAAGFVLSGSSSSR